jgi:hypothetical protein
MTESKMAGGRHPGDGLHCDGRAAGWEPILELSDEV